MAALFNSTTNTEEKMTAIYLRLSNDDGPNRESNSIGNQRDILTRYASENGLGEITEYADDGYSGVLFARPAFQRMISDVEMGKIGTILVKDLSRFGRNNTLVSYYLEMVFPDHNTRLIAVDDHIDTHANPDGLVVNIKSILNEMYVKEASKKIRSVHRQIAERGEFMAKPPYGYVKQNKRLVVDPETAPNVPAMFHMANDMNPIHEIAKRFNMSYERIKHILKNPSYLGNTVNFKYGTVSLKVQTKIPESEWVTKYGTHEALVNEALFIAVQEKLKLKDKRHGHNTAAPIGGGIFDGVLICAVCGSTLLSQAGGSYRCQICFQLTTDDSTLLSGITSDIDRQTSILKTIPAKLAQLRKDESALRTQVKRAVMNDESDDSIIALQQRRAEIDHQIRDAEDSLEVARQAANLPAPTTPEAARALVDKVSIHNNGRIEVMYRKKG
ncbi:recombinase [Clostridia bacterium]|nr:recombinase [Clostridia bacterium]